MKRKTWRIPVFVFLLLYHIVRAVVAWVPDRPYIGDVPRKLASATPTAQYTRVSRPVAWVVLPTNTPIAAAVVVGSAGSPILNEAAANAGLQSTHIPVLSPSYTPTPSAREAASSPNSTVTPSLAPQATLTPTPEASDVTYIVQSGDTLTSIAKRYGVTIQAIAVANNLSNPDFVWVGQVLVIPTDTPPTSTPIPTP